MTAEAVVMNKVAVAMAADSAVTVSENKVFNTATKIFALSHSEPVGALLYGQAELLGIPWETIVKLFRDRLGEEAHASLEEYAEALLGFISMRARDLFPAEVQANYAERRARFFLDLLVERISEGANDQLNERVRDSDIDEEAIEETLLSEANSAVNFYERLFEALPGNIAGSDEDISDFSGLYSGMLDELTDDVFQDLAIPRPLRTRIQELCIEAIRRPAIPRCPDTWSGIVVVGFGTEDVFPRLRTLRIWGVAANHLLHSPITEEDGIDISFENRGAIRPFAQREMIHTFMEGVDPDYQDYVEDQIGAALTGFAQGITELLVDLPSVESDELAGALEALASSELADLTMRLREQRTDAHIRPIIDVVSVLPKSELAELAEALVSLTSLKRKVTNVQETVGGPIDVAVISKKDGLVWIKRKHYFCADLNPHFMARYTGGSSNEE